MKDIWWIITECDDWVVVIATLVSVTAALGLLASGIWLVAFGA